MSFQGDVAGIGLGELLQGLARGGRDGVLNLYGETISGSLGIRSGMLYLLPGPDEDETLWRDRSLAAWSDDPKPLMETRRRAAIARADRLETFYRLLETRNLHFRFEPGSMPRPQPGADDEDPWGQGTPVEYMLLEHARLADEGMESGIVVEDFDIPRAIDPNRYPPEVRDFLEQCNGRSTLLEIADRLGWPLRRCRLLVLEHYSAQALRLAQPRELLAAGQKELEHGRVYRAATRIAGWVRASHPGPPSVGDAEMFVSEWQKGRLHVLLAALDPPEARALLRKLDHVHADPHASLERWTRLAEDHKKDALTVLHATVLRLAATEDPGARAFTDLVRLARSFQDNGHAGRTRTLLRLASYQLPANPQTRIELGRRMLDTGLAEEGVRWLLDVARELIDAGDGQRAVTPIRLVLKKLPDHTQAHGLLIEARALIARQKRRRWKSVVIGSTALVLSMAGLVHVQMRRVVSSHIDEVKENLSQPTVARDLLDKYFAGDQSEAIVALRGRVYAALKEIDDRKRDAWLERYEAIAQESEYGDPLLGLKRSLELVPPPELNESRPWPTRVELLGILTARLQERQQELDVSVEATRDELHAEERLQALIAEMLELSTEHKEDPEVSTFHFHLKELEAAIEDRRERRALERAKLEEMGIMKEQDMLLGAARAHSAAGDLERAVISYERLMQTEDFEPLRPLLEKEINAVKTHWNAVLEAERLAGLGQHVDALAVLAEGCPNDPGEHLLPFRVASRPVGARVTLPNGEIRVTPFTARSSPGDAVSLRFQHDGFEPRAVDISNPGNLDVCLHQLPERSLAPEHRVQALPVPVGDSHVVADRKGRLLRLASESELAWTRILDTLGGVARTPVFLPRRPGFLLVVSEDGRAWLADASNGQVEGPCDLPAPPKEGPALTRNGVWLRLENGAIAIWQDRLKPEFHEPGSSFFQANADLGDGGETAPSVFQFLRRSANGVSRLTAETTGWSVQVRTTDYLVLGPAGLGFTARRAGEWTYVAWEEPKALLPQGRLWVSDGDGLRSYRPDSGQLLRYD
jgi:hypothetical protein